MHPVHGPILSRQPTAPPPTSPRRPRRIAEPPGASRKRPDLLRRDVMSPPASRTLRGALGRLRANRGVSKTPGTPSAYCTAPPWLPASPPTAPFTYPHPPRNRPGLSRKRPGLRHRTRRTSTPALRRVDRGTLGGGAERPSPAPCHRAKTKCGALIALCCVPCSPCAAVQGTAVCARFRLPRRFDGCTPAYVLFRNLSHLLSMLRKYLYQVE